MNPFDSVNDRTDFARVLKIPTKKLTYVLYIKKIKHSYESFKVPKKSGGFREINAPSSDLKEIQQNLAKLLADYREQLRGTKKITRKISYAFEKKVSIINNAQIHRNKKIVLNIDLEDFFSSFHFGRVRGYFQKNRDFKLPLDIATLIAQITCYNGCLPQGAPTSPIITNMICEMLDFRVLSLARKYKLDYSRYADDLTFSTNNLSFELENLEFLTALKKEIDRAGFKINDSKTRLQFNTSRQEVTGLIVNKIINVPREFYKDTRAMAHHQYKYGEFKINEEVGSINQLEGRFSFINQIVRYNKSILSRPSFVKNSVQFQKNHLKIDNKMNGNNKPIFNLNSREKEYQKFLFYKYFFWNKKPLIVTEGKTDIIYIKAALKSMYKDFPELITKENGVFLYKVSFLNRSSRLKFFFDFHRDGADSIKNIYDLFVGKNNKKNYYKYFQDISKNNPKNPVFFLYDNEQKKQKPLSFFKTYIGLKNDNEFKKELVFNVIGNLYLLTNPLIDGVEECEIEDLFDGEILEHRINGRSFQRNGKGDLSKYYGKEELSKYILTNFENINFEHFRPILTNIRNTVNQYTFVKREKK